MSATSNLTSVKPDGIQTGMHKNERQYDDNVNIAVAVTMSVVFVIGVPENSMVLHLFRKFQPLRNAFNTFLIGLTISDLSMLVIGIPFVIASSISGHWLFGDAGCTLYAFIMTFLGLSSITLLTVISIHRYLIVVRKNSSKLITKLRAVLLTCLCFGCGFLWALFPIFGWGSYGLEPALTFCAPNWSVQTSNDTSYMLSLFLMLLVLPLMIIVLSYIKIICKLRQLKMMPRNFLDRKTADQEAIKTTALLTGAFLLCWLPYAIFALWCAFGDVNDIPIYASVVPCLMAKSSCIWNPIVYAFRHKQIRKAFTLWKNGITTDVLESNQVASARGSRRRSSVVHRYNIPEVFSVSKGVNTGDNTGDDSSCDENISVERLLGPSRGADDEFSIKNTFPGADGEFSIKNIIRGADGEFSKNCQYLCQSAKGGLVPRPAIISSKIN